MAKYLGSYLIDKLAMDGSTAVLDNISGAAFTKTGGVGNTWPGDSSNFRTLLGAQAPVIAETSDNLDANANCIFTPWASVTWTPSGGYAVAADVDGILGAASMRVTHAAGGYVLLSRAVTVGQPYTNSCYVKAGNAGAIGRTLSLVFDAVTTNIVLTNNWQRVSVTKASASATPRATTVALAAGSAGDQFLMSAFQRENKAYATPFALDYRTGGYCRIANPLTVGGDASFVFLVNGPWAGNDGIEHTLFSATGAGAGDVYRLYKGSDNKLYFAVGDKSAVTAALTTTTWAANVNHVVIGTVTGGTINVYLAGTAGTQATGATREAALDANLYIGTKTDGTLPANAAIIGAGLGRVLTSGEITALSALASWANLYNSLSLTMPLATATGGVNIPSLLAEATIVCPTAQATGAAPILTPGALTDIQAAVATAMANALVLTPFVVAFSNALVDSMRLDVTTMIADNPSTITISRKTSPTTNGKKASTTDPLDSQTVRLYGKNKTERVREGDEFRFIRVRQVKMLCEHDTDVLEHSDENEDTLILEDKTYRVTDVHDIKWQGFLISKQCTLEEMS